MKTQIVFVINKRIFNGKLTRFFTGCYCYHVGILIDGNFYDIAPFKGRRVKKYEPQHYENDEHIIFDSLVNIKEEMLIDKIINLNIHYGYLDYFLFLFKPLIRIFPKFKLINPRGEICSEQVNNDLFESGMRTPWHPSDHPPSPCTMLEYFFNKYKQQ